MIVSPKAAWTDLMHQSLTDAIAQFAGEMALRKIVTQDMSCANSQVTV